MGKNAKEEVWHEATRGGIKITIVKNRTSGTYTAKLSNRRGYNIVPKDTKPLTGYAIPSKALDAAEDYIKTHLS